MSEQAAQATPRIGKEYSDAASRMRDSLKWLITALGAVGAVLLAGLSLSGIGLASGWRLLWAITGFTAALVGVIVSAFVCAAVLGRGIEMTLSNVAGQAKLREPFEDDLQVTSVLGNESLGNLPRLLRSAVAEQQAAYRAALADPSNKDSVRAYELSDTEVARLGGLSDYVVQKTAYRQLKTKFNIAGGVIGVMCLVIGAGIAVFAWAANPPPEQAARAMPILVRTPANVEVVLSPNGMARLESSLGPECVQQTIRGSAISDFGSGTYRVAVAKSATCKDAVVEISQEDGIVSLPAE